MSSDQPWTFYSPHSSCPRRYWMTPNRWINFTFKRLQLHAGNPDLREPSLQIINRNKSKVCLRKRKEKYVSLIGKRWRPYFYSTNSHNSFLGRAAFGRVPCGIQKKSSDSSPGCNLNNSSKFSCGSITAGVISIGWTLWEWVDFFFFLFLQWHTFALPAWLVPHKSCTWI